MAEFKGIKYLGDIKSSYIIKEIFLFLNEKLKLNMIIYNKQLQKIFGIDIFNYKKISGKYKIGEKNGKGKEYTLIGHHLRFEGEYLNGKRNGKGIEYYNSELKFDGEYLNGKIWNGKGYNKNGKIEFEIKDGKGLVKEYFYDDGIKFEGEYLNGERNGKGKEYYNGKLIFEGEYLNGERNGKGKEYFNDKLIFEGEYLNGKRNGKLKEINNSQ